MTLPSHTLDLRRLSKVKRNAKVNEAIALHVAKWRRNEHDTAWLYTRGNRRIEDYCYFAPATSLDHVMRWLDRRMWVARNTIDCGRFKEHLSVPADNGLHTVKVIHQGVEHVGRAKTFALAACYALLSMRGWKVLT